MLKRDGGNGRTREAVAKLKTTVLDYKKDYDLKSFRGKSTKGKRKRSDTDEGDRPRGGRGAARYSGSAAHQLKAHGYELIFDSFDDDERAGIWERLIPVSSRIVSSAGFCTDTWLAATTPRSHCVSCDGPEQGRINCEAGRQTFK
jgi:hypothetical protein